MEIVPVGVLGSVAMAKPKQATFNFGASAKKSGAKKSGGGKRSKGTKANAWADYRSGR